MVFGLLLAALPFLVYASTSFVSSAAARGGAETPTTAAAPAKERRDEFVPGEVLVRFRTGEKGARVAERLSALSVMGRDIPVVVRQPEGLEIVEGLRLASVPPEETLAAVKALAARPDVLYAEPNYVRRKLAVPNDPRYPEQWSLRVGPNGVGGTVRAEAAWDVTTGSRGVVVGVVDEGLDIGHTDLRDNLWRNPGEIPNNNLDDDGNGYADDVNGWDFFHDDRTVFDNPSGASGINAPDSHGTHVAGIVGATGNNGQGIAGVNWQVSLMSLKVLGPDNENAAPSSVLVTVRAYAYARRVREQYQTSGGALGANLRVLNNSYGGIGRSQAEQDAIAELGAAGILFVAAAGNDGESDDQSPVYPAGYDLPNLINVAWSEPGDSIAFSSNFGPRTAHLSAPGTSILSTTPGNTYAYASGTSMAAPHVSGAAALLCAARPDLSVAKLRAVLLFGGDAVVAQAPKTVTGRRLNINGALQLALADDVTPPSVTDFHVVAQDGRAVTLAWNAPGDDGVSDGQAQLYELRFAGTQPGDSYRLAAFRAGAGGSSESMTVNVPYRRQAGTLVLQAFDEAGNSGSASVPVSVGDTAASPYTVAEGPAEPLTTGGTPLNIKFDDFNTQVGLGFDFPYFERYAQWVNVSTNGSLYLSFTPRNDALSYLERLDGWQMIAGLWDDLDLRTCYRPDADVYMTKEADRVVFRWQGVFFQGSGCPATPTGEPANFEVELRRDGTIIQRYGEGNRRAFPVVGISSGEPEAYAVASHTSAFSPLDLTNAATVTYTLRRPVARANVAISEYLFNYPYPVRAGDEFEVPVTVINKGPDRATGVRLTTSFPAQARLVSCHTSQGACARGDGNSVRADFGGLDNGATARAVFVFSFDPSASPNFSFDFPHKVTSSSYDASFSDNETRTLLSLIAGSPTPLVGVTAVSAGGSHTLALKPDGTVAAWGANPYGQIGNGGPPVNVSQPQGVRSLTGVAFVAAGQNHSLALKGSGAVWAWGDNSAGQLGDGTTTTRRLPFKVPGLSNITAIAAGSHSLAVGAGGAVWAWGANGSGQLGDGSTSNRTAPVQVQGLSGVKSVAAGGDFSVALKTDGTVWAWGANGSGQLGNGTTTPRNAPVQVQGLTNVVAVAAGRAHALALRGDGTVWSWGANNGGQLGDASFTGRTTPVQVSGLAGATAIDCGEDRSAALRGDGTVWGWGSNLYGAVGDGTSINRFVPVKTLVLRGALGISVGSNHAVALTTGGLVWAWGYDYSGQLGDGNADQGRTWAFEVLRQLPDPPSIGTVPAPILSPDGGTYSAPQIVRVRVPGDDLKVSAVTAGYGNVMATTTDGKLYGWGRNQYGQLGYTPPPPAPGQFNVSEPLPRPLPHDAPLMTAATENTAYALRADGTVWAWGSNGFGALGTGTTDANAYPTPVQVPGLSGIKAIGAGGAHTVALKEDGTVWTWGWNDWGQLGDGTTNMRFTPAHIPGFTGVVAIAVMYHHNYALKADGTVWAWGDNYSGDLGDGEIFGKRVMPVQVKGLTGVKRIFAGNACGFALREDGTLWHWGDYAGVIYLTPHLVPGMTNVRAVGAGDGFIVVAKEDGTVWAWGKNDSGQIGTGQVGGRVESPRQVAGLDDVVSLAVSTYFVAALKADGTLWTWGYNEYGQLGNGTYAFSGTASRVETLAGNFAVHYTTDGREPTDDDPVLPSGGSVLVDRNTTLKARAWRDGWNPSGTRSAAYRITNNRVDDTPFFVSQHYRDFFGREPDAPGLQFWSNEIESCGSDFQCHEVRRINVSAAFFLSIEFQETGYLVERMYKAAYGDANGVSRISGSPVQIRVPSVRRAELLADGSAIGSGLIVGRDGWQQVLETNKTAFALTFVQRQRFADAFPASMTGAQYVDKLFANAGVTPTAGERQAALGAFGSGDLTGRAAALRAVAQSATFDAAERNRAFVLMQYFGYLQRDPDSGPDSDHTGYNFWLGKLNEFNGNFVRAEMVKAFITSTEYANRFGP